VNHVFVETNFFIDTLRPFPAPAATALLSRVGTDISLYVPWVAIAEAKRTLDRIIREDLGFTDMMERFALLEFQGGQLSRTDKPVIDQLAKRAATVRATAIKNASAAVDALAARTEIIEPTKAVITKTLSVFSVKRLKPFDEMVLGAVLTKAAVLKAAGEQDIFFCDLNTKDFDPANRPALAAEYTACGITFKPSFVVP
jgi:predicted nucleic acid-binding protein